MVAPNTFNSSKSPFTMVTGPGCGLPIRRVSDASIDKLAANKARQGAPSTKNSSFPLKLKPVKKGATKAKAVRFSEVTRKVVRVAEATADVPTWYQARDYAVIKYEILSSIHAITKVFKQENTTPLDLDQHCLRGIETGISKDLHQRRKMRIHSTTQGVLELQRRQRRMGVSDPVAIRAVSLQCSHHAQESARSVGQLDSQL